MSLSLSLACCSFTGGRSSQLPGSSLVPSDLSAADAVTATAAAAAAPGVTGGSGGAAGPFGSGHGVGFDGAHLCSPGSQTGLNCLPPHIDRLFHSNAACGAGHRRSRVVTTSRRMRRPSTAGTKTALARPPLQDRSAREPLQDRSAREPLRDRSAREPLRDRSAREPLRDSAVGYSRQVAPAWSPASERTRDDRRHRTDTDDERRQTACASV